jgi:alpha-tubulin suppressor-like RCC1 family protein
MKMRPDSRRHHYRAGVGILVIMVALIAGMAGCGGDGDGGGFETSPMVSAGEVHTVGLKSDGTVVVVGWGGAQNVNEWKEIIEVAAGVATGMSFDNDTVAGYTVGLKSDGTMVTTGDNTYGQCNVGSWTGIAHIVTGHGGYTVGLKSDGTVLAVGDNLYGQCNVGGW